MSYEREHSREGLRWDAVEERALLRHMAALYPLQHVADMHGRSKGGILARAGRILRRNDSTLPAYWFVGDVGWDAACAMAARLVFREATGTLLKLHEEKTTMSNYFWMVLGRDAPTYRHRTEAEAVEEAKCLANIHSGQEFIVLRATHKVKATGVTVEKL